MVVSEILSELAVYCNGNNFYWATILTCVGDCGGNGVNGHTYPNLSKQLQYLAVGLISTAHDGEREGAAMVRGVFLSDLLTSALVWTRKTDYQK